MGTNVISGSAKCVVIKTANNTYFGKIAKTLSSNKQKSSFQKGIEGIIMPYEWFRKEILELSKKYNVPIYIYSIANIEKAVELFNLGIKAIYSYNLTYDILEEHLKKKNYRLLSYS